MSSQGQGTPFYNISDSAGYRLIELPPDLERTLTSPGAPALYIESGADDTAVLRCYDDTYKLRQKNTSNGLFVLKPHAADSSSPETGIAAIATINETVELELVRKPEVNPKQPHTGSKGKWHEIFGKNR